MSFLIHPLISDDKKGVEDRIEEPWKYQNDTVGKGYIVKGDTIIILKPGRYKISSGSFSVTIDTVRQNNLDGY